MKKLIIGFCFVGAAYGYGYGPNTINVSISTNDPTAAGIGYAVNGKKIGGAGKSYLGKGPINSTYTFGYRKKSASGRDIFCGTHRLTKDSTVFLISKGNKCRSVVR